MRQRNAHHFRQLCVCRGQSGYAGGVSGPGRRCGVADRLPEPADRLCAPHGVALRSDRPADPDVSCYYKEMSALAAQESGLSKEFISGINSDENAVMRELYLSTNAVRQAAPASTSCAWLHRGGEDRRADSRLHQPYVRKGGRELGMLPAALLWDSMGDGSYGHLRRSGSLLAVRMVRPVKAKMIAKTKLE